MPRVVTAGVPMRMPLVIIGPLVSKGMLIASLSLAARGTCAIGAYNQAKMDLLIGVDGDNEFTIYAAPVGRLSLA